MRQLHAHECQIVPQTGVNGNNMASVSLAQIDIDPPTLMCNLAMYTYIMSRISNIRLWDIAK